jgi:hypothetical protein
MYRLQRSGGVDAAVTTHPGCGRPGVSCSKCHRFGDLLERSVNLNDVQNGDLLGARYAPIARA